MPAIWGIINKSNQPFSEKLKATNDSMNKYCFDRIDSVDQPDLLFSCGHQYFTPESKYDTSPLVYNKELYFTGDCYLFNRSKLIDSLKETSAYAELFKDKPCDMIGDVELSLCAYLVYGKRFVEKLRGSFAFAVFSSKDNTLTLFSDHFFTRYLLYSVTDDYIFFGTTIDPLKAFSDKKLKLNREFILNSYKVVSPVGFFIPGLTPYENVYQLDLAQILSINVNTGQVTKEIYWDPIHNKKRIRLKSDEDCKEQFLGLYQNSVDGMLRSLGETGITLSGGLDSSSVAALAATTLSKQGKNLYSYTQIPAPGYEVANTSYCMENESGHIMDTCELYPNIIPHFLSSEESNCYDYAEDLVKQFGFPIKAIANLPHIQRMYTAALEDGCKIVLQGGNGNSTVSFGQVQAILYKELKGFQLLEFYNNITSISRLLKKGRKKFLKDFFRQCKEEKNHTPEEDISWFYNADIKKYGLQHPALDFQNRYGQSIIISDEQVMNFRHDFVRLTQYSFYHTMQSLIYNIMPLDPTKTVELAEFTYSIPYHFYLKNGVDRRLIRAYMKDMLPPSVTSVFNPRGVQAADLAYCIDRDFDRIRDSFYKDLDEPLLKDYINEQKIASAKKTIQENEGSLSFSDIWDPMLLIVLGKFLRLNQ